MSAATLVLIVAHQPLASALKQAAVHVLPEAEDVILACDIAADESPENSCRALHNVMADSLQNSSVMPAVLALVDILGATPSRVALAWAQSYVGPSQVVCGANLAMVLRAYTYRQMPLPGLAEQVCEGGQRAVQLCTQPS